MSNRVLMFIAGVVFAIASAAGLYRLMVGFPIVIAGVPLGQTSSFFAFVISAVLSFLFFKAAMVRA
jgi:hypothetical protein